MPHHSVRIFESDIIERPADPQAPLQGLGDLYQEVIVDHSKRPRFKYRPALCHFCEAGKNPLCGDSLTLFVHSHPADPGRLAAVGSDSGAAPAALEVYFEGSGCSISQASASMMCAATRGLTAPEILSLIGKAEDLFTGKVLPESDECEQDFESLAGVSQFPVRIKCAALAWKTLELLVNENFDAQGFPVTKQKSCQDDPLLCTRKKRSQLKIVSA